MARERSSTQLSLLDEGDWKLDRRTRDVGRRGIAQAREALRRASSGEPASSSTRDRAA